MKRLIHCLQDAVPYISRSNYFSNLTTIYKDQFETYGGARATIATILSFCHGAVL